MHMLHRLPIVKVACVALLCDNSVILVPRMSGLYKSSLSIPGGKVEHGETLKQAACRELYEELGITLHECDLFPVTIASNVYTNNKYIFTLFSAKQWTGTPTAIEHEKLVYLPIEHIKHSDFAPADYRMICDFIEYLKK